MKSTDSKLYFTDVATGEVRSLTGIQDIEFCTNKQQRQELPFKSTFKGTAELEYELSDNETIENLLKYNSKGRLAEISGYIYCGSLIQMRTHKKRRINKKWLKKYGYKPKLEKIQLKFE